MKEDLVLFCNAKEFESNEIVDFIVLSGMFFIYIFMENKRPLFHVFEKQNKTKTDNKAQTEEYLTYYLKRVDSRIEPSSFCLPTNNALPLGQAGFRGGARLIVC